MEKPFGTDLASARVAERAGCTRSSPRSRSSASTTSSARSRRRTSWRSASPTACSSRSGTATSSTTCRSTCPRRWASASARGFYETDRRLSRHGGDAPVPDPRLHGDGAADRARAGADQRGEEQGLPQHAADRARRRRARPVHRLPRRGGRRPGIRHRDLHRAEVLHRQLALGRRAVLPAHRQAPGRRASASSRSPSASRRRACSRPARASARRARTI